MNEEINKPKRKFNKKLLMFALPLFAIVLVSAGLLFYAQFSATFTVLPSIGVSECNDVFGDVYEEDVLVGEECIITNDASTERNLLITNDAGEGIDVSYKGTLELNKKDSEWSAIGDPIEIEYTIVGDEFEVTGVQEGYTAIYYKDEVVELGERIANPQPAISIVGTGNLPETDDANWDELANYCDLANGVDNYNQCKGAKIWVVLTTDITGGTLNWANMANYYYELDLIQYNTDGEITLYPGASLTITPVYEIGIGVSGYQEITTTIA